MQRITSFLLLLLIIFHTFLLEDCVCESWQAQPQIESDFTLVSSKVWTSEGTTFAFPELQDDSPFKPMKEGGRQHRTGVCFSGGGTRGMAAAMGQMRALRSLGLWEDLFYLSAVSGGAWAAAIYTYYSTGAANDDELLGTSQIPQNLSLASLSQLSPKRLAYTATRNFAASLAIHTAQSANGLLSVRDVWNEAIGSSFLEPFGLYSRTAPKYFSLNADTVADIVSRNPSLTESSFQTYHSGNGDSFRPFLIINAGLTGPSGFNYVVPPMTNIQFTPLYCGQPFAPNNTASVEFQLKTGARIDVHLGGGVIEPFAFNQTVATPTSIWNSTFTAIKGRRPWSMSAAAAASSAAYAYTVQLLIEGISPQAQYAGIRHNTVLPTRFLNLGDGGSLENSGLLPLLQRGIEAAVVFINTGIRLNMSYDPTQRWPPTSSDIDYSVTALFGVPTAEGFDALTGFYTHNKVFEEQDLRELMQELIADARNGNGAVVKKRHRVVSNPWWGIEGGWEVDVCWIYLQLPFQWEKELPPDTKEAIAQGDSEGPLRNFPNYNTIDNNGELSITYLTKEQINALAEMTDWVVRWNAERVTSTIRLS